MATSRARNKIKHFIHNEEKARSVELGKRVFERDLRRYAVDKSLVTDEALLKVAAELGGPRLEDLYAAIGYGKLTVRAVLSRVVGQDAAITAQRNLSFFAYQLFEEPAPTSQSAALRRLKALGLPTEQHARGGLTGATAASFLAEWGEKRHTLEYETDGAVIKLNSLPLREQLGATAKAPRWGMAYKYAPDQAETRLNDITIAGTVNGQPFTAQVERGTGKNSLALQVQHNGKRMDALVVSRRMAELHRLMPFKAPPDMSRFLLSPMPGLLVDVAVQPGQKVQAGERVAVIEAMKMENVLFALQDGVVKSVVAKQGESLSVDQVIVEFEA